jgi:hypothetical protein
MSTLLENIRKTLEESYDIVRDGASTIIDKAEDFGKISKLRFEIRQTGTNVERKLTILGDAVFPHLMKNDVEALKDNPAIKLLVEEIQDLNMQMDDKQKEIDKLVTENKRILRQKEQEKLHEKISKIEQEIEERMLVLKQLKNQ